MSPPKKAEKCNRELAFRVFASKDVETGNTRNTLAHCLLKWLISSELFTLLFLYSRLLFYTIYLLENGLRDKVKNNRIYLWYLHGVLRYTYFLNLAS